MTEQHPLTDEICEAVALNVSTRLNYRVNLKDVVFSYDDMRAAYNLAIEHFFQWIIEDESIRIDAQGFHYREQCIEDAGEAHRLLVGFLRLNKEDNL